MESGICPLSVSTLRSSVQLMYPLNNEHDNDNYDDIDGDDDDPEPEPSNEVDDGDVCTDLPSRSKTLKASAKSFSGFNLLLSWIWIEKYL